MKLFRRTKRAAGEPTELQDLPPEVRRLVHAVDAMRDGWAEGDDTRRHELWKRVHEASDAVWGRNDAPVVHVFAQGGVVSSRQLAERISREIAMRNRDVILRDR